MSPPRSPRLLAVLFVPWLVAAGLALPARAGDGSCSTCGSLIPLFCPVTTFCRPRPPHIHWKCVCPKPICNPCELPHYGYYHTCWHPYPFPPDYSHCEAPPPEVLGGMMGTPAKPATMPGADESLPSPRKVSQLPVEGR
jgi:hypothetical protein